MKFHGDLIEQKRQGLVPYSERIENQGESGVKATKCRIIITQNLVTTPIKAPLANNGTSRARDSGYLRGEEVRNRADKDKQ